MRLLESVISCLGSLLKGEHKWKAKWKRKQADILFNKNSCLASKRVLGPIMSSYLQIKKLWISTSHLLYLILSIHPLDGLPPAPPISKFFYQKISLSVNLKKILNSQRNGSAPGINMIPYKIYKLCPNICDYLFRLFESCFKNWVISVKWKIALRFTSPNQAVQTQTTSRTLGQYLF